MQAISQISMSLKSIELFHSDRRKEFDNHLIDDCLAAFGVKCSLSGKGCPYDNTVAEATFKAVKTTRCLTHLSSFGCNLVTV